MQTSSLIWQDGAVPAGTRLQLLCSCHWACPGVRSADRMIDDAGSGSDDPQDAPVWRGLPETEHSDAGVGPGQTPHRIGARPHGTGCIGTSGRNPGWAGTGATSCRRERDYCQTGPDPRGSLVCGGCITGKQHPHHITSGRFGRRDPHWQRQFGQHHCQICSGSQYVWPVPESDDAARCGNTQGLKPTSCRKRRRRGGGF